jgi:SNF2 family DNA or RNA helicase
MNPICEDTNTDSSKRVFIGCASDAVRQFNCSRGTVFQTDRCLIDGTLYFHSPFIPDQHPEISILDFETGRWIPWSAQHVADRYFTAKCHPETSDILLSPMIVRIIWTDNHIWTPGTICRPIPPNPYEVDACSFLDEPSRLMQDTNLYLRFSSFMMDGTYMKLCPLPPLHEYSIHDRYGIRRIRWLLWYSYARKVFKADIPSFIPSDLQKYDDNDGSTVWCPNIEMYIHQKETIGWMLRREENECLPSGIQCVFPIFSSEQSNDRIWYDLDRFNYSDAPLLAVSIKSNQDVPKILPPCGIVGHAVGLGKTAIVLGLHMIAKKLPQIYPPTVFPDTYTPRWAFGGIDPSKYKSMLIANSKATLVIMPSTLVRQWQEEVSKFLPNAKVLCVCTKVQFRKHRVLDYIHADFVFTTYSFLEGTAYSIFTESYKQPISCEKHIDRIVRIAARERALSIRREPKSEFQGIPLESIFWRRVVFDEAHILFDRGEHSRRFIISTSLQSGFRWFVGASMPSVMDHLTTPAYLCDGAHQDFLEMPTSKYAQLIRATTDTTHTISVPCVFHDIPLVLSADAHMIYNGLSEMVNLNPRDLLEKCSSFQISSNPNDPQSMKTQFLIDTKRQLDDIQKETEQLEHKCNELYHKIEHARTDETRREYEEKRQIILQRIETYGQKRHHMYNIQQRFYQTMRIIHSVFSVSECASPSYQDTSVSEFLLEQDTADPIQDEDMSCPICYNKYTTKTMTILECNHMVCADCIRALREMYGYIECPICRKRSRVYPVVATTLSMLCTDSEESKCSLLIQKKIQFLYDLLHQIPTDEKVIVFLEWDSVKEEMAKYLRAHEIPCTTIRGNLWVRQASLSRFCTMPSIRIALLSMRDSACGSNLTVANHVVFLHPLSQFTSDMESERIQGRDVCMQAIGRCYRCTQTRPVHVYNLWMQGTIEEDYSTQYLRGES